MQTWFSCDTSVVVAAVETVSVAGPAGSWNLLNGTCNGRLPHSLVSRPAVRFVG